MEVVAFFVCMAIIAQTNAAPTPESGSNVPHYDKDFDLPPMARDGFEITVNVSIHEGYNKDKLKLILLPNDKGIPDICANNNIEGTHICILPNEELQKKSGSGQKIIQVGITARLNRSRDGLRLSVDLNGNHGAFGSIPLKDYEKLKHFSVGGIVNYIQMIQFNFNNEIETIEV